MQKSFSPGKWSFLGPGSEKKWYSTHESKPQGEWDRVAELMMLKFGESKHPVFRATSRGKMSIHFCADQGTIETVFRTIISVNHLSIYGTVLRFVWRLPCQNRETCFGRTIRVIVCTNKCDEDTYTFDRWSCARRRSIAKVPRTSWKVITTKSCD